MYYLICFQDDTLQLIYATTSEQHDFFCVTSLDKNSIQFYHDQNVWILKRQLNNENHFKLRYKCSHDGNKKCDIENDLYYEKNGDIVHVDERMRELYKNNNRRYKLVDSLEKIYELINKYGL